jgi:hypothetical protein
MEVKQTITVPLRLLPVWNRNSIMPSFFDQIPSARGGGFFAQLPSMRGVDPIEEGLQQARANAIHQASRAVQKGDAQFARDILMPFGITQELDRGRTESQSNERVVGSADRGYSVYDRNTGQTREILPGRKGMLSDTDKARVRMVSNERNQILKSLNELPATHASRPALEAKLAEVESSLKLILGEQQAPQQAPKSSPAPRNQSFMGGQTALEPKDVAQLEEAERGYFGSGRIQGLDRALPPIEQAPTEQTGSFFDAMQPFVPESPGFQNIGAPAAQAAPQFQPPTPPVSQGFPTNQQGVRQFGTEAEAIAAGVQPGEVFEVFDPATQRLRPARLRN